MYQSAATMVSCKSFITELRKHFATQWNVSTQFSKHRILYGEEVDRLSKDEKTAYLKNEQVIELADSAAFKKIGQPQIVAKQYVFLERLIRIELFIQQYMQSQNSSDINAIIKCILFLEQIFFYTEVVLPPVFLVRFHKSLEDLRGLMSTDTVVNRLTAIVGKIEYHNHQWIVCLHQLYFHANGMQKFSPAADDVGTNGSRSSLSRKLSRPLSPRNSEMEAIQFRRALYTTGKYLDAEKILKELVFLPRDHKDPLGDNDYFRVHMQLVEALSYFSFTEDVLFNEVNQKLNATTQNIIKALLKLYIQFHACQLNNDAIRLKYKARVNYLSTEHRVYKPQNGMNLAVVASF